MRYAIILLILSSCHTFDEDSILKNQNKLLSLIVELESYEVVRPSTSYDIYKLDSDDIDSYATTDISDLSIDYIVKNISMKNPNYSGFVEENDSLVIFINKSNSIRSFERRIIYDFSENPRNFGNDSIVETSYQIKQLDERWYYCTLGLD